jgi:hypothetical protein
MNHGWIEYDPAVGAGVFVDWHGNFWWGRFAVLEEPVVSGIANHFA